MAMAAGVSPATVQWVWSARALEPYLVKTFKLSNDKRFEEKLVDMVGVYLNPRIMQWCCVWTKKPNSRRWIGPSRRCR